MNKFTILIYTLLLLSCSNNNRVSKMQVHKNPVVAHRGAWKKMSLPENSIAAIKQAVQLHCTGAEFDVWMTADDSLVINHDPHFQNIEIEKTDYATLQKLKLTNGEPIPTLQNYLLAGIQNNKGTLLVVEIKPSRISKERGQAIAQKTVALINQLKLQKKVTYISFDYDMLKKIIAIDQSAFTQYLAGDKAPAQLHADGIKGMDYHFSEFKKHPDWVQQAKDNHITLNAWTVNEATDMRWLLDSGFHYITTNEPELLFEVWKETKR